MKIKIFVAILVALTIVLTFCARSLQQVRRELVTVRAELEVRENVWFKLRSLSLSYHDGLTLSVPDFQNEGAPRPTVVRNDDWEFGARYEFTSDGKSARLIVLEKEVDWSYRVVMKSD